MTLHINSSPPYSAQHILGQRFFFTPSEIFHFLMVSMGIERENSLAIN